jgi:hypothetical protein
LTGPSNSYSRLAYRSAVVGVKQGRTWRAIGYRYHRKQLVNLILELEHYSSLEKGWDEHQASQQENKMDKEQKELQYECGAQNALRRYRQEYSELPVEKLAAETGRERGQANQIVADLMNLSSLATSDGVHGEPQIQKELIDISKVPDTEITDTRSFNKGKACARPRRREGLTIDFDPSVYVRTEADVDVLREKAISTSQNDQSGCDHCPINLGRLPSILRTSRYEKIIQHPKSPHYVIPLRIEDSKGKLRTSTRSNSSSSRWASPESFERFDTSGHTMKPCHYQVYIDETQGEAREWDAMDLDDFGESQTSADLFSDQSSWDQYLDSQPHGFETLPEPSKDEPYILVPALKGQLVKIDGGWYQRASGWAMRTVH